MGILLLLVLLSSLPGRAQSDSIDSYIRAEMKARGIPGLALTVIRDGEVIKLAGYGLANVELDVAATPDSVFELASVTKQFTAAAIMLFVEEGRIGLDDPISQYLPNTPKAWEAITVRHLLTHTAGLPGLRSGFRSLYANGVRISNRTTEMFAAAVQDPMSFQPGEQWQYSDVGYFLLGMVLEKATGQRYRDLLAERFFQPLGMTSSSVLDQSAIVKNRASGYTLRNGKLVHIRRVVQNELTSHYGVLSTVRDLVKWELALAAGKVLTRASLEQMWTAVKLNDGSTRPYGFGWIVDEVRGHRFISHDGITGTEYSRFPDDGLTVIVLTNLGVNVGGTGVNSWGLTVGVADRYIPGLLVSSIPPQPDPDPQRLVTLRGVLTAVARGQVVPAMTPALNAAISPTARKTVAARLETLVDFGFIACDQIQGRVLERFGARIELLCYYRMRTSTQTRYYTFWLTADGRVADFNSSSQ
jgi:CubicO group peptidase (beta-lactamase class C family)